MDSGYWFTFSSLHDVSGYQHSVWNGLYVVDWKAVQV